MTETVALGDLFATKSPSVDPSKFPDEVFDLFSVPAYENRKPDRIAGAAIGSNKIAVEPGDVLICRIVPHIRRAWVVPAMGPHRQIASGEWIVLRDARVHPEYLRQLLLGDGFHREFMRTVAGVGGSLMRARPANAASIRIPLPPLPEQRRIASFLDEVDSLRAARRTALHHVDQLPTAMFDSLFGAGLANVPIRGLGDVVAEATSVTYGIVQAGPETPGGIPYIRTGDLVDGEIRVQGLRLTSPEIAKRFPRSTVRAGEIVMSIRATVGTTALVPEELDGANLTQGTARIAPGPDIDAVYLLGFLRSRQAQAWIAAQVKGATFREITLGRLRELPVPVPRPDLQQRFAQAFHFIQSVKSAHESHLAKLDELFASLQYRAFRGEL